MEQALNCQDALRQFDVRFFDVAVVDMNMPGTLISADDYDRPDDLQLARVAAVLGQEQGNNARTARALGIHRRKLYRLLERDGIGSGG